MEFSEIFGFLIILNESIKLLPKNWKFMASIATLSLLLPSILFLSFIHFWQVWTDEMTASLMNPTASDSDFNPTLNMLKYLVPLLAVEIAFLIVFVIISHLFNIATILVSANSYTGKKLPLRDLFSDIKKKWRSPLSTSFGVSAGDRSTRYLVFIGIFMSTFLVIMYPNPVNISIAIILWIIILVFQLYSSVVSVLAVVVSFVEVSYEGKQALDKAGQLVEGQRVHGFMLNLFVNLLVLIISLVCWIILGDKGSLNLTIYGLLFVNFISLLKIFMLIAYTVYYFRCKKHRGEEVEILGDDQYQKLPTTEVVCDVP